MASISINLLPKEILLERQQNSKLSLINRLSVSLLIALVFFTSTTLAMRLMQNTELKKAQQDLVYAQERVSGLKSNEEQAFLLKDRLKLIQTLSGGDLKRKTIFNLVIYLTPPDMHITEVMVDKGGNMTISLDGTSLTSIQTLFTNLGSPEKNSDLISKISMDGLSLGRDSIYRFTLRIAPK